LRAGQLNCFCSCWLQAAKCPSHFPRISQKKAGSFARHVCKSQKNATKRKETPQSIRKHHGILRKTQTHRDTYNDSARNATTDCHVRQESPRPKTHNPKYIRRPRTTHDAAPRPAGLQRGTARSWTAGQPDFKVYIAPVRRREDTFYQLGNYKETIGPTRA